MKRMTKENRPPESANPGQADWGALRAAFAGLYGSGGAYLAAGSVPGLRSSLAGFDLYASSYGYTHIVTRGLSQVDPRQETLPNGQGGWGLEFSIKWPAARGDLSRALHIMDRLAEGVSVRRDGWSLLYPPEMMLDQFPKDLLDEPGSALALVPDTEIPRLDTPHGEVLIRQIIRIPACDRERLERFPSLIEQVIFNLSRKNAKLPFC